MVAINGGENAHKYFRYKYNYYHSLNERLAYHAGDSLKQELTGKDEINSAAWRKLTSKARELLKLTCKERGIGFDALQNRELTKTQLSEFSQSVKCDKRLNTCLKAILTSAEKEMDYA